MPRSRSCSATSTSTSCPSWPSGCASSAGSWQEQCTAALAAAAARCEDEGAVARGLVYAQRLVERDPLAEHGQRRLMRLHYLRGDRAAAIAAFERFEQRLKDELGTRPSAETIELLATIERGAAALPVRRATAPASLLRPPRLIGRDRELQALEHAWANRRAFMLVGEAGIGKSRLLQEFCAGRAGVVVVQARPGDAGIAYAVAGAPAARRCWPRIRWRSRRRATRRWRWCCPSSAPRWRWPARRSGCCCSAPSTPPWSMRSAQGLQALVVDDLHFADEASVEFLQTLAQSETLAALHWGFAQRPAEPGAAGARLRAALEEAARLETGVLQPLDLAQLAALVESIGLAELSAERLAPALLRHTGGNPMFALETLKDLVLSGSAATIERGGRLPQPVTVGALVERRLGQLTSEALRLARVAALAGPEFSAELAVAVLEAHPLDIAEPWRELETAQVLRDGGFAHDLIFETTRASVPMPIAQLLHRRIALHLAARAALPEQHRRRTGPAPANGSRRARPMRRRRAGPRARRSAATRSSAGVSPPTRSTRRARPTPPSMRAAKASIR